MTLEDRLKGMLGELMLGNANLAAEQDRLTALLQEKDAEIQRLKEDLAAHQTSDASVI